MSERRVAGDGVAYTLLEFQQYFGISWRSCWEQSQPLPQPVAKSAPLQRKHAAPMAAPLDIARQQVAKSAPVQQAPIDQEKLTLAQEALKLLESAKRMDAALEKEFYRQRDSGEDGSRQIWIHMNMERTRLWDEAEEAMKALKVPYEDRHGKMQRKHLQDIYSRV